MSRPISLDDLPTGLPALSRMRKIALILALLAIPVWIGTRVVPFIDGSFDNGEIVNGEVLGPIGSSCTPEPGAINCGASIPQGKHYCAVAVRDRCVDSFNLPSDERRIARITSHGGPPTMFPWESVPTYLGRQISVYWYEDGTRIIRRFSGVGVEVELRDIEPSDKSGESDG